PLDTHVGSIPLLQFLRIFCLEENSADACDSFHHYSSSLVAARFCAERAETSPAPTLTLAVLAKCIAAPSACASSLQSRYCRAGALCCSKLRRRLGCDRHRMRFRLGREQRRLH